MAGEEIIEYYDYLMGLAASRCGSQSDAEDLVGDTMLAAIALVRKGEKIEHPKTWLANTFFHKYSDSLRKKYRAPVTLYLEDGMDVSEEFDEDILCPEEAARVRKELNHLGRINREVLIRFYYGNQSVADIAGGLGIPEGTVKSRLYAGRDQMKKGLENMETKENVMPGKLYLSFGGADGLKGEPISLVEDDLIAQNLLILAYEKPVTVSELSKAIGIPAAYIEPIIKKLTDGELMVQTDSGKVYSDFIIQNPPDRLDNFQPQLNFARKHFDLVWGIIAKMTDEISSLPFVAALGEKEKTKLSRYAVLKALQDFTHYGTGKIEPPKFPPRRDGGRWIAQATAFGATDNEEAHADSLEYMIHGGHRTSEAVVANGTKRAWLFEFDTTLFDSPHRYGGSVYSYELYFKHIIPLLWCIREGASLDSGEGAKIPGEFISRMPTFETLGLLERNGDKLSVAIPVLEKSEYNEVLDRIRRATESIQSALGEEFEAFISKMKTPIPKHLTSVPELFRYGNATAFLVMAFVREAYNRKLHLKDVDYCCPPVLLVYEK